MTLLFIYVALALGVSFICSIMEAVLLSLTPSYVAQQAQEGRRTGALLQSLKDDVDRPLAAILTLNTIAHTVGATGAGAEAVKIFGDAWIGVISAVLTLLILFFSEIIPKTLGAVYWRQLGPLVARMLKFTIIAMYPIVVVAQWCTRLIAPPKRGTTISRRELLAMAELGATQGVIGASETRLFRNLLKFRHIEVSAVMTPRVVMAVLDATLDVHDAVGRDELRFSRIPIHTPGDRDDITAYVLKDAVLDAATREERRPLSDFARRMLVIPPSATLPAVFRHCLDQGEHIALVAGEYGDVLGLVTMEDILEALLGLQIVDEGDAVPDMRDLAKEYRRQREGRQAHARELED